MRRKAMSREAPKVSAASSTFLSKRLKTASMVKKPNGRVHETWTRKVVVSQESSTPISRIMMAKPKPTRMPGAMMPKSIR